MGKGQAVQEETGRGEVTLDREGRREDERRRENKLRKQGNTESTKFHSKQKRRGIRDLMSWMNTGVW